MRLIFAGTPKVAVTALNALHQSRHEVVAVVTRPDARRGRGRTSGESPVAECAERLGLLVIKTAELASPELREQLVRLRPDCCPVVAFGGLIPNSLLDLPPRGWVNLHFSLLPSWRGAAPVQHAVLHGDAITGASTFRLTAELDAGPIFGTVTEEIRMRDTSGDVLERLQQSGAELLVETLDAIERGEASPVEQPADGISVAPKLTPDDARVRWSDPALAIDRRIRACTPAPGSWTLREGARIGLLPLDEVRSTETRGLRPGEMRIDKHAVWVGTGSHAVALGRVKPAGKSLMPAADWARGARLTDGDVLT